MFIYYTLNIFILQSFIMIRPLCCVWIVILSFTGLVCSSDIDSLAFEVTNEVEMMCPYVNPDSLYSDYSDILEFLPTDDLQSVLQEEQARESSCALDVPVFSNAVNSADIIEELSAFLSFPSTGTDTAISSVQVQSTVGSAKRACDAVENTAKRQKKKTKATANTALMDEAEVRMAVEEFRRCFGPGVKIWRHLPRPIIKFANNLAQRGLTSAHSSKIVELCTASEEWLDHYVFWRMLLLFVDTMSLEVTELNRLEDKKTVVLRDRKPSAKPLSEGTKHYIGRSIAKCRGAKRMEIECSLNVLEGRDTADVLAVLRWFLYHVKIECVGITCDLTEAGMSSAVFGRQMQALTKEWRETRVRIDSLALRFRLTQYKDAAVIVKECSWATVLKIHFIGARLCQDNDINQMLKTLLLHCPTLDQLSVFGFHVSIEHIRTIAAMLPQLMILDVGFLSLDRLLLGQKKEKESMPVFPGLKTLKLASMYSYLDASIKNLACLFPNLKFVQIPSRHVTTPLIDALSSLRLLRTLEVVDSTLDTETAVYLLDKLPNLECLSVGVSNLDIKLAHALSKYVGMHTLKLRGYYTAGFLASLLRPSPLMSTLKVLSVWRNSGSYRKGNFSIEDKHSKDTAMKNFGCEVEIRRWD
ncbi:hypothetical protein NECID01_2186 [Nematocida sp. AWRm77]|nr:hypothetical protein NECID01_2186 [Nematocida sp. AWRm77]